MKVLVVEDEALIALALTDALTEAGHQVVGPAASSVQTATLAREQSVTAAFVDVDLEEKGAGFVLAREVIDSKYWSA